MKTLSILTTLIIGCPLLSISQSELPSPDELEENLYYESYTELTRSRRVYLPEVDIHSVNPVMHEYLEESLEEKRITKKVSLDEQFSYTSEIILFEHPENEMQIAARTEIDMEGVRLYDANDNLLHTEVDMGIYPEVFTQYKEGMLYGIKNDNIAPFVVTQELQDALIAMGMDYLKEGELHHFTLDNMVMIFNKEEESVSYHVLNEDGSIKSKSTDFYQGTIDGSYRPLLKISKVYDTDPEGFPYYQMEIVHYSDYYIYKDETYTIEDDGNEIYVTPNPVNNGFHVKRSNNTDFQFSGAKLIDFQSGQILKEWEGDYNQDSYFITTDVVPGMYLLSIRDINNNQISTQLIID